MCNVHITFYETEQVVGAESAFVPHLLLTIVPL